MASAQPPDRVRSLTWEWDYLANTIDWTDDASSFYERSLGAITNGDDESGALRPSAIYLASNVSDGTGGGAGWVEVDYGVGGNVTAMTVHSQCADSASACTDIAGDIDTRRAHLRANCACAQEQHYVYRWDELNRLDEARRFDRTGGPWTLAVRQRHRYDSANQRTVKQTLDQDGCTDPPVGGAVPCERIALYPYPGDFERRGLVRGFDAYEANADLGTETQYLIGGARPRSSTHQRPDRVRSRAPPHPRDQRPHPNHRRRPRRPLRRAPRVFDLLPQRRPRNLPQPRRRTARPRAHGLHRQGSR